MTAEKIVRPYGSWSSPITPALMTDARPAFDYPTSHNGKLYWLESRPWENGRSVVVEKNKQGQVRDLVPAPLSVRSKVHEYGGTPYIVIGNMLYFCLQDDQRIYRINIASEHTAGSEQAIPEPITPAPTETSDSYRFADFCYDKSRNRLICVAEINSPALREPENCIVTISLENASPNSSSTRPSPAREQSVIRLVTGSDFYAYPRVNPAGNRLCWIDWNHPDMPWDSTRLYEAEIYPDGSLGDTVLIVGQNDEADEPAQAIFQPQYSPHGQLHYVSDINNWWNIYRIDTRNTDILNTGTARRPPQPECLCELEAEFATPLWVLGMSTYGFCDDGTLLCCYSQNGQWQLAKISNGQREDIATPYTAISAVHCAGGAGWFIGAAPDREAELVAINPHSYQLSIEQKASPLPIDNGNLSTPVAMQFSPHKQGTNDSNSPQCHGFYYPPCNAQTTGPADEQPPLIVMCHGGPTGATSTGLNLKIQFWTSRGFAVLDLNYRGSTGYGRTYRHQLDGAWGIADIEDVVLATQQLVDRQLADPERLAIRGSSAGGYTVLAALTFTDTFKAGACLYGIGDLETLARDTHKFESRYLDRLVGSYPESQQLYRQRSPVHFTNQLNCPVIFFQGLDDKVVPPQQAVSMVKALREQKIPVAYLPFPGEGHGFRAAQTVQQVFNAELYFYSKVFGFELPESLPAITIDNLP